MGYGGPGKLGNIYKILGEKKPKPQSDYYPDRFVIELCENVHIHYRNIRIELSMNEMMDFYRLLSDAMANLQEYLFEGKKTMLIPIGDIDPFDNGHIQADDSYDITDGTKAEHEEGIELFKQHILDGGKFLPIVIWKDEENIYRRMDGFKRFWALKELGFKVIPCYVLSEYVAGVQEGMPVLL